MNQKVQGALAFALTGLAFYLLATQSGKSVSQTIATGVENMLGDRGFRNNNPGNIRLGDNWQGMSPTQSDGTFVQFVSPEYGIRAIAHILNSYASRGIRTVQDIISTWAPPNENNTQAYIDAVAGDMGVDPTATVDSSNKAALIAGIIRHENGSQPYTQQQIDTGIAMA